MCAEESTEFAQVRKVQVFDAEDKDNGKDGLPSSNEREPAGLPHPRDRKADLPLRAILWSRRRLGRGLLLAPVTKAVQ